MKIPGEIQAEIEAFASLHGIKPSWFNDNASRNLYEVTTTSDELFHATVYRGSALTLYTPTMKVLLLSKIYPMLDRPSEAKDLNDIETLFDSGAATKADLLEALEAFKDRIRFESDRSVIKKSWALHKTLTQLAEGLT